MRSRHASCSCGWLADAVWWTVPAPWRAGPPGAGGPQADRPPRRPPGAGVLEEGQVGPGRALLVAVEQVIDRRIVLVDALLHQPQPEHADVELDIARRIAGDRCDVVDALELHRCARGRPPPLTPR